MTEEYNRTTSPHVGTNWWDMASSRTSATATSSSSSNLTSSGRGGYVGSGGEWLLGGSGGGIDVGLVRRSSSSMDNHNSGVSGNGMDNYHHPDGSQLQVMGLGLSCHPHQSMDWNHQTALLEKGGEIGGFRSMLQEGMAAATTNSTNFQHNETAGGGGGGMLFGSQMGQWKPSNLSYSERSLFPPGMQQQQQHTSGNNNMNAPSSDQFMKSIGGGTRGFSPSSSDQLGLSSSTSTCSRIDNSTCQQGSLLMPPSSSTTYHTALDSSSSSSVYDSPNSSSSSLLQGLIISPNPPPQSTSSNSSYGYHHHHHEQDNYVGLTTSNNNHNESSLMGNSNWPPPPPTSSNNINKMMNPQFLRNTGGVVDDKELNNNNNNQLLHFTNNGPFWNSTTDTSGDVRPGLFFPSLMQNQMGNSNTTAMPTFEEKPKISQYNSTAPTSSAQKKTSTSSQITARTSSATTAATGLKRSRGETTMPPFKVRKEKMGDRITALQQLVSPFGKTDTASVLSEAIEYIKFLHEQVSLLSTPYLKSGTGGSSLQHQQTQQSCDKSKDLPEGPKRDLRSRGLCLVPVSSTFPVAHETSVDFWTPTFGGTFR